MYLGQDGFVSLRSVLGQEDIGLTLGLGVDAYELGF